VRSSGKRSRPPWSACRKWPWKKGPDPQHLETTYDFLDLLLRALTDLGVRYEAVAVNVSVSAALPITFDLGTWVNFTDPDAIIARTDLKKSELKVSNPTSQNFEAKLVLPIGDGFLEVPRGWSTIDVKLRGKSYRFADAHLKAFSVEIRNLRAQELAASLPGSPLPVVLAGEPQLAT
jgi:hypothetical protein